MKTIEDIKFYIQRFKQNSLNYIETILFNTYDFLDLYSDEEMCCRVKDVKFVIYKNKIGFVINAYRNKKRIYKAIM